MKSTDEFTTHHHSTTCATKKHPSPRATTHRAVCQFTGLFYALSPPMSRHFSIIAKNKSYIRPCFVALRPPPSARWGRVADDLQWNSFPCSTLYLSATGTCQITGRARHPRKTSNIQGLTCLHKNCSLMVGRTTLVVPQQEPGPVTNWSAFFFRGIA